MESSGSECRDKMIAFGATKLEQNATEAAVKSTRVGTPQEDRDRNAILSRIQDQELCVRSKMQNLQWQDVRREFDSLLRLVDELGMIVCLPASYIKLLDDLDTKLRVTECDKKSFRAMSKPNAGAFQALKTQVQTALKPFSLDNHRDIIDVCKEEAVTSTINGCDVILLAMFLENVQSHLVAPVKEARAPRHQRTSSLQQIREKKRSTAFYQCAPKPKAVPRVPRRLEDLPAAERDEWCSSSSSQTHHEAMLRNSR